MSVATTPGFTASTQTPGATSAASAAEIASTANFVAQYGAWRGAATRPHVDETFTTRPAPRAFIAGT